MPFSEPRILIPDSCSTESLSPSSISSRQERLPQAVYQMIVRVTDELKNATYRVDLTAEGAILHTDPNTVKAVIDYLEESPGTANPTRRSKSSAAKPRLPSDGSMDEDDSYGPLVHLLNKVVDAAIQCRSASHLSRLQFYHFGTEVKEGHGCVKRLKPDDIGIIRKLPTGTKDSELSWEDIKVIFESKRTVEQMVQQSGM